MIIVSVIPSVVLFASRGGGGGEELCYILVFSPDFYLICGYQFV